MTPFSMWPRPPSRCSTWTSAAATASRPLATCSRPSPAPISGCRPSWTPSIPSRRRPTPRPICRVSTPSPARWTPTPTASVMTWPRGWSRRTSCSTSRSASFRRSGSMPTSPTWSARWTAGPRPRDWARPMGRGPPPSMTRRSVRPWIGRSRPCRRPGPERCMTRASGGSPMARPSMRPICATPRPPI
ncbi:hypothetical protein GALL_543790 [mine drainage metagenome]|uniref:Uncharacterized protein n=1 Tax=mine drainage metagenome TaxID=410659 RepID=A0A1J5PFP6_9ZZZZ